MSESQQGPQICDVISAKRYLQPFIGISTLKGKWRLLGLHASDKFFWATPSPQRREEGANLVWLYSSYNCFHGVSHMFFD